ncbi:cytochrome c oxidase assembly protein [Arthrobacter gandavensis]|uniref:cytochrome c oxidase assembly protein n=1 Tax=Arthrobacter gandavensis TaxID=169960 RepID=UPI00188DF7E2|nr:cytochrome c oxidase assembly protein [Arthrobacter gandavensis]MBF4993867.1 cytochrome c oxidase assembly protein [Arthrobacter gandavensis]
MDHSGGTFPAEAFFLIPAVAATAAYVAGACSRRARGWPKRRTAVFILGVALAVLTILGPLPGLAHRSFTVLSLSHVVAGMVVPVLLVLARPVTLALRSMDRIPALRTVRILRSTPARILSGPLAAAVLNIGGMYLMFRTPLFDAMRTHAPVHWIITFHLVAAGYLWTAALIGRDPNPHRAGLPLRAGVLLLTAAAHNVLAKSLYAQPPAGIPADEAEAGAMAMYYAGGAVELAVMIIFCLQWYRGPAQRRFAPAVPEYSAVPG